VISTMSKHDMQLAMFPGMFDPITNGHLDVIERGRLLFDELVVAVGDNPAKGATMLDRAHRVKMVANTVAPLPNVRVEAYDGLTIDLARRLGAKVILRGIRSSVDLCGELQMAETNRTAGGVETVFIATSARYAFISSSLIRQIARGGGDVSAMVPKAALPFLRNILRGE